MIKKKDEIDKPRQKLEMVGSDMTFLGGVLMPSVVLTAIKVVFEIVMRIPGKEGFVNLVYGNLFFFALIFVTATCAFFFLKRKAARLDNAQQVNSFLTGAQIDRFRPIEMRMPSDYPMHVEFEPTAKSLKSMRYLLLFATGGMTLISLFSMIMGMSFHNTLVFMGFLLILVLPVLYINLVVSRLEESLRENSFHLAHSDIYELELVSLTRDMSGQHMMYKLTFKMGDTLKNYHVRPMKNSEKNFSELGLTNENCPQKISAYINPTTGEPLAIATRNGPAWLSNAEIRLMFIPPRQGAKLITMARPIVPLEYDKGIKLLADKSSKATGLQEERFVGIWNGLYGFDHNAKAQYACSIKLAKSPSGGLCGMYHHKMLGPLYGKVTVEGKSVGNELYLEIVYHSWLCKLIEKTELWAGIYDPETRKITGTFKKGSMTGGFVLARDYE